MLPAQSARSVRSLNAGHFFPKQDHPAITAQSERRPKTTGRRRNRRLVLQSPLPFDGGGSFARARRRLFPVTRGACGNETGGDAACKVTGTRSSSFRRYDRRRAVCLCVSHRLPTATRLVDCCTPCRLVLSPLWPWAGSVRRTAAACIYWPPNVGDLRKQRLAGITCARTTIEEGAEPPRAVDRGIEQRLIG